MIVGATVACCCISVNLVYSACLFWLAFAFDLLGVISLTICWFCLIMLRLVMCLQILLYCYLLVCLAVWVLSELFRWCFDLFIVLLFSS